MYHEEEVRHSFQLETKMMVYKLSIYFTLRVFLSRYSHPTGVAKNVGNHSNSASCHSSSGTGRTFHSALLCLGPVREEGMPVAPAPPFFQEVNPSLQNNNCTMVVEFKF